MAYGNNYNNNQSFFEKHEGLLTTAVVLALLVAGFSLLFGLYFVVKNVGRGQRLADARNQVTLNEIQIKQTQQLVQVARQKADIKVEEAKGIAQAQKIINDTLTPQYLQHEAIQAQETQSNKIIYVPSGNQGIPLVSTINP